MPFVFPGVYVEELPGPIRVIAGVPTAVGAFVGRARMGPVDQPVRVKSIAEFDRIFGGLWPLGELGYAVHQYFQNGGADAYVVRVVNGATHTSFNIPVGSASITVVSKNPGAWTNGLKLRIDHNTRVASPPNRPATLPDEFNLTIELSLPHSVTGAINTIEEVFRNLSADPAKSRFIGTVLDGTIFEPGSSLVSATVHGAPGAHKPAAASFTAPGGASDGAHLTAAQLSDTALRASARGIYALENADIFTLLNIAAYSPREIGAPTDLHQTIWTAALQFCREKRAILVWDPPSTWNSKAQVDAHRADADPIRDPNAVAYFPRILFADPLNNNIPRQFPPGAAMAGIIARTDATRGIWKAPAGREARISGAAGLACHLTDRENADLNRIAVNCLRVFSGAGTVCWGSRTLAGADVQGSEWKYLPIRRTALFIEESIYRSTKWTLFEPNDEPLWAQVRLSINSFMDTLFRQGAFAGRKATEAFFVKCDSQTTTREDVNNGRFNILVGFAPLKPAEFVVIKIGQLAAKLDA